jgi:hypothetical protein
MAKERELTLVDVDREDGKAMVTFSDDTVASYSAAELASFKPDRVKPETEPIEPEPGI